MGFCRECSAENPAAAHFCRECGLRLLPFACPKCGVESSPGDKYCGACGADLAENSAAAELEPLARGERKQVTILFSDLSGYTAMTEKLDPEEVQEIMSRIFGGTAQIVARYEGHIDKFIGDAVMALFGVPRTHEDDPVRAIRAALEIHELVRKISPQLEERVGRPLSMHSGVNSGMVVTGAIDLERGTEKVLGDTVNLAARLTSLAEGDEILVGADTYEQAKGHFHFQALDPASVKGKKEHVQIHKVLSPKSTPAAVHRLSGLRAELIGRENEMLLLREAGRQLKAGRGAIISVSGEAGTGKSRLVEEFRAGADESRIEWLTSRSYPYSQRISFFPVVDLLNHLWRIEEGDSREAIRGKIESGAERLLGKENDVCGCIGRLYSLDYPGTEGIDPESWKSSLFDAVRKVVTAASRIRPTVVVLEDLHWADRSSLELFRAVLPECGSTALFLCLCRPPFRLFDGAESVLLKDGCREITLGDLSPAESQEMMWSLLKTAHLPSELRDFIQEKVEGNPFYLEEIVNSLIESDTLVQIGAWKLTRTLDLPDIPLTISGVISARIDRLDADMKRILQEASVIGRSFLQEILRRITSCPERFDECLAGLERLDLIRAASLQPDLEYVFKHALTQDVVYNGLLKKERQQIHERIGEVIEELSPERRADLCETLAFHFKEGLSLPKAVDYLIQSGKKSLKRFAVEESHHYYRDAYDLLAEKAHRSPAEEELLVELLNAWAPVYYYRGAFGELEGLLDRHLGMAETLSGKESLGMYYVWLGMSRWGMEKFGDAYRYMREALQLAEKIGSKRVAGYAHAWLPWICVQMGLLDEAFPYAEKAREMSGFFESDHYPYFESLDAMGYVSWARGESGKTRAYGKALLDYGHGHSSLRGTTWGHIVLGWGQMADGNFPAAIECHLKALQVSADPFYSQFPKLFLGLSYISNQEPLKAKEPLVEVLDFSLKCGCKVLATSSRMLLGAVQVAEGRFREGTAIIEECRRWFDANQGRVPHIFADMVLGEIYLQMIERRSPVSLGTVLRNILFLAKNLPRAGRKAERHLERARESARDIGGRGIQGQACLRLGGLYAFKGEPERARAVLAEAVSLFDQCEAEHFSRQARTALAALGGGRLRPGRPRPTARHSGPPPRRPPAPPS